MLGAIFDKISKTNKNVLARFDETEYTSYTKVFTTQGTLLSVTGEGYIDQVTKANSAAASTGLTIVADGVTIFNNTNTATAACGIIQKNTLQARTQDSTYPIALFSLSSGYAYGSTFQPTAANLVSLPFNSSATANPLCIMSNRIRFKKSLVITASGSGSTTFTIGVKI